MGSREMKNSGKICLIAAALLCLGQGGAPAAAAPEKVQPCDVFAKGVIPHSYRAQSKIYFYKTSAETDKEAAIAYIIQGDYFIMSKQKDGAYCAAYMPDGEIKAAGFTRGIHGDTTENKASDDAEIAALLNDTDAVLHARNKSQADYAETGGSEYSGLFQNWDDYNKAEEMESSLSFYNITDKLIGMFVHAYGCVGENSSCWRGTIWSEDEIVLKVAPKSYIALSKGAGDIPNFRQLHYITLQGDKLLSDGGGKINGEGSGTYRAKGK